RERERERERMTHKLSNGQKDPLISTRRRVRTSDDERRLQDSEAESQRMQGTGRQ
ncbi:hypothetical protein D0Y65_014432, partial [Glycine soja]